MVRAGRLYRQGCGFKSRYQYKDLCFKVHETTKVKKIKSNMKTKREVLTGSFESSKEKLRRDTNHHVFKFITNLIKKRKNKKILDKI